jgi:hypothetical protein
VKSLRRLLPSSTYAVLSDWSDCAVVEQLAHDFASGKLCIVAKDAKSQKIRSGGGAA